MVHNFGCRASQADGAAIEAGLVAEGLAAVDSYKAADWVVFNTCTVTSNADDDLRQAVRRVQRENPAAQIMVTGCYAQRAPDTSQPPPPHDLVPVTNGGTQGERRVQAAVVKRLLSGLVRDVTHRRSDRVELFSAVTCVRQHTAVSTAKHVAAIRFGGP